jgi:hypothetical protein
MDSNSPADSHKVGIWAKSGDVDETGEIVDLAEVLRKRARAADAYERLAAAFCDESVVDVDEHRDRVAQVVELARRRSP